MADSLNKLYPEVRLRAFRAVDEPHTCRLFIEGHTHVLTSIGVVKVTSSKHSWTENPAAFVMVVESMDGKRVYGGARVHVAGGSEPLPIEQATGNIDPKVYDLIRSYAVFGTGELCGLWNSREIAGYGIGSIFLIRAGVAIAYQIGLKSLFALCAPYTIKPVEGTGMMLEPGIGNKGTFYYPKLDLVATTMLLSDVATLTHADPENKAAIFAIRESADLTRSEFLRNKEIIIHYKMAIKHLDNWSLAATIKNSQVMRHNGNKQKDMDII